MNKIILMLVCITFTQAIYSQFDISKYKNKDSSIVEINKKHKWWNIGAAFTNSWTTLNEYSAEKTFYKPSLGGLIFAEFSPIKYVGIHLGFGYTQRGPGIILPDLHSEANGSDPDSTYRMRLRSNNFYFPIALRFKSPDIFKNFRITASGGIAPNIVFGSHRIMHDTDGGFHTYTEVNENFAFFDLLYHSTFGVEFMAGWNCLFRVEALGQWGNYNQYKYLGSGDYQGKNVLYGLQLTVIY